METSRMAPPVTGSPFSCLTTPVTVAPVMRESPQPAADARPATLNSARTLRIDAGMSESPAWLRQENSIQTLWGRLPIGAQDVAAGGELGVLPGRHTDGVGDGANGPVGQ